MDAADIKRAKAFEVMCNTDGWKMYQDLLNTHINDRVQKLFMPMNNLLMVTEVEHNKGAIFGLIQARDLPGVSIAAMKEIREAANSTDDEEVEEAPVGERAP